MKLEDKNFKEEFLEWLNSKTNEELVNSLKEFMRSDIMSEEDIKILENLKERTKEACECSLASGNERKDWQREVQAIENILADRERLKRENEELRENNIRNLAKGLNNNLNQTKKHNEDLDSLNEGWKIEVKELQTKANKYDSLVEKINDKLVEENMHFAKRDEIVKAHAHTREVLKELLEDD